MTNDPRFEVQAFGTRIQGEGVAGIVGAIVANFLDLLIVSIGCLLACRGHVLLSCRQCLEPSLT